MYESCPMRKSHLTHTHFTPHTRTLRQRITILQLTWWVMSYTQTRHGPHMNYVTYMNGYMSHGTSPKGHHSSTEMMSNVIRITESCLEYMSHVPCERATSHTHLTPHTHTLRQRSTILQLTWWVMSYTQTRRVPYMNHVTYLTGDTRQGTSQEGNHLSTEMMGIVIHIYKGVMSLTCMSHVPCERATAHTPYARGPPSFNWHDG